MINTFIDTWIKSKVNANGLKVETILEIASAAIAILFSNQWIAFLE